MKKIAIVFLSLFLVVSLPLAAHANIVTTTGKYIINAIKHVPGGAKVDATNTVTGAKHVIKHGVTSQALGQGIGAGIIQFGVAGGLGLAFEAITGAALSAVDWMMDTENNQIKWKNKNEGGGGGDSEFLWGNPAYSVPYIYSTHLAAAEAACKASGLFFVTIYAQYARCGKTPNATTWTSIPIGKIPNPNYGEQPDMWKKLPLNELAAKTLDLADGGNALAQKDVEDYVTAIAKRGDLDTALDNATDVTKPDDPTEPEKPKKECPVGTIRVGDICIALPDDLPTGEQGQCGICCAQLIAILAEMAKMNEQFYEKSLDNDAQALIALNQINAQLNQLTLDFNALLAEVKLTNQTLTEINNNQELHFNELKQKADELKLAIETGDASILAALADVQSAIDLTNLKLDKLNINLEKVIEHLERMQKCEETEFNKKICEFIDWVKQEPDAPDALDDSGEVDIIDKSDDLSLDKDRISFDNQCPPPKPISLTVAGLGFTEEFNYQPMCDFFSRLKPFVIGMGGISSALIIAGGIRRG